MTLAPMRIQSANMLTMLAALAADAYQYERRADAALILRVANVTAIFPPIRRSAIIAGIDRHPRGVDGIGKVATWGTFTPR